MVSELKADVHKHIFGGELRRGQAPSKIGMCNVSLQYKICTTITPTEVSQLLVWPAHKS